MDAIKEQAKKEVDDIWQREIQKQFSSQINKCLMDTLKVLKEELANFDSSINEHINKLDEQFNEKWEKRFNELNSQISQIQQNNNANINPVHNDNNNFINDFNNNNNNNNNNMQNQIINNNNNIINVDNDDDDNDNDNDDNNNIFEKYEKLRKKVIDLANMKNPPLIHLLFTEGTNPLVNIILQCICNIKALILYYFNPKKEEKILSKAKNYPHGDYLGPSFLKLLDYLWKSDKKEYCPEEIHGVLKKLMLNDYETKDPNIIINFILTQLNEELMQKNNLDENKEPADPFEIFDEKKVFNEYWERFNEEKTKIKVSFYSTLETKKRCKDCNYTSFSFDSSPIINIYLNKENSETLNFEDFKYHLIEKEKEIMKEKCVICADGVEKKKIVAKDIYYTPEVLIININREKDPKYQISFKYPEQFDIEKIIKKKMEYYDYSLTSVIKKDNDGYIVFCKNCINEKWYSYNKEKIELVNNYNELIIDDKKACILIYTGKKNN